MKTMNQIDTFFICWAKTGWNSVKQSTGYVQLKFKETLVALLELRQSLFFKGDYQLMQDTPRLGTSYKRGKGL